MFLRSRLLKKLKILKAFSFLEVMISLFLLSVGFLGVLNLAGATLQNSLKQHDIVIASMLAQEGVELVYNIRDTNVAKGNDVFDGASGPGDDVATNPHGSKIDYDTLLSSGLNGNCNSVNTCRLNLNAFSFYTHRSGVATKFSRKVTVTDVPTKPDERLVEVMVYWGKNDTNTFPTSANCSFDKKCASVSVKLYR